MKKVFTFLFTVALATVFCGCSYPTAADLLPEKLGIADDGLWLYRLTARPRSDGSGEEALPLETQIDGEEAEMGTSLMTRV